MQNYGLELNHANNCLMNYISTVESKGESIPTSGAKEKDYANSNPEIMFIHKAWEWYYKVFRNINGQLPLITHFDLQTCSPSLYESRDLELGVPGTYTVSGHSVRIKSFNPIVSIIKSKQRPRKLKILGEDGRQFIFLLKGHEDLRQDERAMQLFGLVNALLSYDRRTSVGYNEDFSIQRYAVMPLSTTAGLISWVPNCDTLHDLIRSYRESRKVMLDVEHRLILQVAPEKTMYDQLPIMHKVEVFEYALDRTAGEDLSKILWLKSESSESWLQRRTTYTRSLAVMSMVG
jgi:FKBP12-rapamycin complex-associated protein